MTNSGIVEIHGRSYMTVAKRLELLHEDHKDKSINIETEVLQHVPVVVIKARILTSQGIFTGISSANPAKAIEKSNPYEVAETSAVGRALGFAGYGLIESVASADEMIKATTQEALPEDKKVCNAHEQPVVMFQGKSKTKTNADGTPKAFWYHVGVNGEMCFGSGYQV